LTSITATIISTARAFAAAGASGTNCCAYDANATASVATDPLAITKNAVQPYRNAGSGPNASRTYA